MAKRFTRYLNFHGLYKKEKVVFWFTLFYISLFTALGFSKGNREFIFYSLTMLLILILGIYINKQVRLPEFIVAGLSLLGLLHILGGNINVDSRRLYEALFFYDLIRYDNIVHTFGSIMATFVLNTLFFNFSTQKTTLKLGLYYFALILMALGVGVFNEIFEFIAVLFFNAHEQVGDYYNNSVDLIYNLIGALIAILIIDTYRIFKLNK